VLKKNVGAAGGAIPAKATRGGRNFVLNGLLAGGEIIGGRGFPARMNLEQRRGFFWMKSFGIVSVEGETTETASGPGIGKNRGQCHHMEKRKSLIRGPTRVSRVRLGEEGIS